MRHKFSTPAEFLAAKRWRQERSLMLFFAALTISSCVVTSVLLYWTHKPHAHQIVIEGSRALIPNERGNNKLWDAWSAAANLAAQKWTAAGINPGPFNLIADPSGCGPGAIACASIEPKTIYVAKDRADVDRTTIMMHEIGHLLGVPHIDGDALMDAKYQGGPLEGPTEAAMLIAKSKQVKTFTVAPGTLEPAE